MTESGWCAYCGEKFKLPSAAIVVSTGGEKVRIHRSEYGLFMERGILKYKDHPRTGPFSETTKDIIMAVLAIAVIVVYTLSSGSRVA